MQSLLEEILADVGNLEFRSPVREVPQLLGLPDDLLSLVQRAIELLDDVEQIRTFRDELVAYISSDQKYSQRDSRQFANSLIGYATGYYDDMKVNTWFDALQDISHPIMGRQRPFLTGKDARGVYIFVETEVLVNLRVLNISC